MKKHISLLIFILLAYAPGVSHAGNEPDYLSQIALRDREVVKHNREVELSMLFDLSSLRLRTQHTLALTPVLVSKDGNREWAFPPLVVDGRIRNKVYLRAQRLESVALPPYHDATAQVVIRRRNGKEQSYDYSAKVPYERWMLDGRIELREEVHGCVNCDKKETAQPLGNVLPAFVPEYRLDTIAPEPEPVKVRAETRTARLQFRQDSYKILPDFKDNRAELDTVSNSILLVRNNPDVKITGIYITGYASPEGSVAYNQTLSENRAKALLDYIVRYEHLDRSLLHVNPCGEDWEGFIKRLDEFPGLLGLDRIREIIAQYPDDHDRAEAEFRQLIPPTIYQRLLNEIYPLLRRNEYKIEYNVRNFNLEEARRMVNERPDLLSLTEMYKVAGSYGKGSPEYDKVMRTAARCFPETATVLNDLALEAISRGEYGKAVELLEKARVTATHPTLLNTLGVAYAEAGEYRKAEEAFAKAAEAGAAKARHNLEQVRGVIDQL